MGEFGICRLSVLPVRDEPSEASEMVTQMLFGDHYTVLQQAEGNKWLQIEMYADQYSGWIDSNQHHVISQAYFDQINSSDYKICTDVMSSILYNKHHIHILIGSILPISTNELFKMEEQLAFNGESKSLSQRRDIDYVKKIALKYLNAPYLWGGRSPFGIDCSGFVQNVFKISGYWLPRDSSAQVNEGIEVAFDERRVGDLAFFARDSRKISHVGLLMNKDEIIHASGKVKVDTFDQTGIFDVEKKVYTHQLHSIRRILKD